MSLAGHLQQPQNVSIDSLKDLFNPKENTINLAKLSVALKQAPLRNVEASIRTGSSIEDEETLQGILSLTLQKLKRRPGKLLGKLKPIAGQHLVSSTLNPQPKIKNEELVFLDDLTQEDKFYLI